MIDDHILVSVVMPVHNGEKFLCEAIESVLNQTYKNFELLIIENCSTDKSLEVIKSYDDPRIRIIIEEDRGQVQAYNRGFKESIGEYIFIHDQDDISDSQRFEKQLKLMKNNSIDICGSDIILIDKNSKKISESKKQVQDEIIKKELFYKTTAIHNSSVCIRSKVLKQLNYWIKDYFPVADCEFYLRARVDYKFANIQEFLYYYRRHSNQLTAFQKFQSTKIFLDMSLNKLDVNKMTMPLKEYYFIKGLIYYYSNYMIKAFYYIIKSIIKLNYSNELFRYLFIIVLLGIPLKLVRKTNILDHNQFPAIKKYLDKIFHYEYGRKSY